MTVTLKCLIRREKSTPSPIIIYLCFCKYAVDLGLTVNVSQAKQQSSPVSGGLIWKSPNCMVMADVVWLLLPKNCVWLFEVYKFTCFCPDWKTQSEEQIGHPCINRSLHHKYTFHFYQCANFLSSAIKTTACELKEIKFFTDSHTFSEWHIVKILEFKSCA